ncbi:hypothetical protein E3T26_14465 [Cryobacterium sp. TMT1-21]|uniref:hypothetical protein n=1 Tax=Cryobacterium sp. TMT1-21 TaxID=1259234 RepID=UPI00106D45A7|nr:hypothetical protein [Cryobacterium sp. TMT1-21]TFD09828.1 hypothetical protein E3T26_14465 [Cryobacterium sp. TMT1-21]
MVDTLHPVDSIANVPLFNGRQLRQLNAVAFGGATAARPLGGRSGVRPGTSVNTVTATATTWTCGPFAGAADVEAAAEAGLVSFALDAAASGAIAAANASYPRSDLVYVQIDIPVEDGSAVPVVTRKYVAGPTVSSTPSDPPLPVSRAYAIARINVPIAGGGSPTVTWIAPYAVAAGGVLPVPSSASYPASPFVGQVVDDAALGVQLRWGGSGWRTLGPFAQAVGSLSGAVGTQVVTFPAGRFTLAPLVSVTALAPGLGMVTTVSGISATQMTVAFSNSSGYVNGQSFHWQATQATAISAAG